jgi:hypothetical protein
MNLPPARRNPINGGTALGCLLALNRRILYLWTKPVHLNLVARILLVFGGCLEVDERFNTQKIEEMALFG